MQRYNTCMYILYRFELGYKYCIYLYNYCH